MSRPRHCVECGAELAPKRRASRPPMLCSDACRTARKRRLERERYWRDPEAERQRARHRSQTDADTRRTRRLSYYRCRLRAELGRELTQDEELELRRADDAKHNH